MTGLKQYTAAVYEAEEGGYWAEVLELPGCAAQGESLRELQVNLEEAIEAWIETQIEVDGEAPRKVHTLTILMETADDGLVPA